MIILSLNKYIFVKIRINYEKLSNRKYFKNNKERKYLPTLAELVDVISRPLFKLSQETQSEILEQWHSVISLIDDSNLASAPWKCQDEDDQIFLDLAYQLRPTILISKDNAVLQLASCAAQERILITSDYNAFKLQN